MAAETEQRKARAELEPPRGDSVLGVPLRHVERRLEQVEANPHQRPVDEAVAHVVELGAQQPEEEEHPDALGDLLDQRPGQGCRDQQHGLGPEEFPERRVLGEPLRHADEHALIQGQRDAGGDHRPPQDGDRVEPG